MYWLIKVNKKWIDDYYTKNTTWYIITSNSPRPIMLDTWGDRRFTIIKTWKKLKFDDVDLIMWDLNDQIKILNYVNWLEQEYWQTLPDRIIPLMNLEKEELLNRSKNDVELFWDIFIEENKHRNWEKIRVTEINDEFLIYCTENWIDFNKQKWFLFKHSKFYKKQVRIWDWRGYWIEFNI